MGNIIKTTDRNDHSRNNLSRKDYNSKWEYTRAVSKWHFDKWVENEKCFKVFLGVRGDWKKELEELQWPIDVSLLNYGFKGKDHDDIIGKDFIDWGYDPKMVQYNRTYDLPEGLRNIALQLKLKHPDIRIHRQMPGMVAPIHVDTYCSHPAMDDDPSLDVSLMRRFVIQLTDWDWGHFWQFGNESWQQWKAGDVAYFESRDVLHATANGGKEPRITMIVTGWMTDETMAMIEGDFQEVELS